MKKIWNNDWHNLVQIKDCIKNCSFDSKLEAKELHGVVSYFYVCSYKNCKHVEEVKDESGVE